MPREKYPGETAAHPPLTSDEAKTEDLLDRLVLEIKAMALLYQSEEELRGRIEEKIIGSHDENVRRFVTALQSHGPEESRGRLALALGELLTAAILVVAGVAVLVPTVAGVDTLSSLVQYFAERTSGTLGTSPLSPYLSFMEFAVGAVLLLSAFFALREAALNLRRAGLAVKSGEV
jgi:hypothetical protein